MGGGSVGVRDLESPCTSVKVRLYYPIEEDGGMGGGLGSSGRTTTTRWLPGGAHTAHGYLSYALGPLEKKSFNSLIIRAFVAVMSRVMAFFLRFEEVTSGGRLATGWCQRFPCIVFSHGLAGMRTTYTGLCKRLANAGLVVAAVEHRDGSASSAEPTSSSKTWKFYEHDIHSSLDGRQRQIARRASEMRAALELLSALNDTDDFKGRLLMSDVWLVGHSFGALTVLETAAQVERSSQKFKGLVCLDPWLFAANKSTLLTECTNELLIINSDCWNPKWTEPKAGQNNERLSTLINHRTRRGLITAVAELKHTRHSSFSDIPAIVHSYLAWLPSPFTTASQSGGQGTPFDALDTIARLIRVWMRNIQHKSSSPVLASDLHESLDKVAAMSKDPVEVQIR